MDFLSKKSWHPSRIQNVEKVWKAEQMNKAEKKKMEELRRKLEEERQITELKRLQAESGSYRNGKTSPRAPRLDVRGAV